MADENQRIGISYTRFCLTSLPHKRLPDEQIWEKKGHHVTLWVEPGRMDARPCNDCQSFSRSARSAKFSGLVPVRQYFNADFCDLAARGKVRLVAYDLASGLGIAEQLPAVAVEAAIEVVRVDGHAFQPSKLAAEF